MINTKRFNPGLVLILICILLSACGPSPEELAATSKAEAAAAATSTPTIKPTYTPTTPLTATNTPIPSNTPKPTLTPTPAPDIIDGPKTFWLVWPAYSPIETWEGFPIHPDAVKGQEYMGGYLYSTYQTGVGLKEYYLSMLGDKGWHLAKIGESERESFLLIFQNGDDEVSITILDFGVAFDNPSLGILPPRSVFLE